MNKEKVKAFLLILKERFTGAEITNTSVVIAYYILLSLFPMIIIVGSILPYLHIDPASVIEYMEIIVPDAVEPILEPIIRNLLTTSSGGVLTLSTIALLWSASKGINYLQGAMNQAWGIELAPGFVQKRVISLLTLLLAAVLLLSFIFVFSFGEMLLGLLVPVFDWAAPLAGALGDLKWPVTAVFTFCMMVLVYAVTPDTVVRLRDAAPGALLTTAGLLLLAEAFALYLRFATRSFTSYGALSTFFVLMFWLNFSAMLVVAGGVLNASIFQYRFGKPGENQLEMAHSIRGRIRGALRNLFSFNWFSRKGRSRKPADVPGASAGNVPGDVAGDLPGRQGEARRMDARGDSPPPPARGPGGG